MFLAKYGLILQAGSTFVIVSAEKISVTSPAVHFYKTRLNVTCHTVREDIWSNQLVPCHDVINYFPTVPCGLP